jgi:membrane protease YdiL (CAAX protease family)
MHRFKPDGHTAFPLFILLAYGQVWAVYGVVRWFDIPFSMNLRHIAGALYLYGAGVPSIAAIIATLIIGKKEGLRELFTRSFEWRFSPMWYVAAILTPVIVTVISTIAAVSFMGATVPEKWFSPVFGAGFLVFFLIYNGVGEEVGWRGLGVHVLQHRLGSLGGNLGVGVIWALWHLPLFNMPGSFQYGDSIILYVYLLTCWSVVMGMLVNKSKGSVLVAILFHETANLIAFTIRYPGTYYVFLIWGIAAGIAIVFLPRPLFRLPWRTHGSAPDVAEQPNLTRVSSRGR